jgi:hypothetical protein
VRRRPSLCERRDRSSVRRVCPWLLLSDSVVRRRSSWCARRSLV